MIAVRDGWSTWLETVLETNNRFPSTWSSLQILHAPSFIGSLLAAIEYIR